MNETITFEQRRDQHVRDAIRVVAPTATDEQLDQLHVLATVRKAPKPVSDAYTTGMRQAIAEQKSARDTARNKTGFEQLIPLDTDWCDEPFPVDALPAWASDYVNAAAQSSQVPAEMAGAAFLGALATVTRGNVLVRVTDDYVEPGVLWQTLVASSGERKSQNMRLMMSAVDDIEATINADLANLIAQDAAKMTDLNAQVTLAENALKSTKLTRTDRHIATATLMEATQARDEFKPVVPIRLLADDATPEGIVTLLAGNQGSVSIASTEGNLFAIMTGRYNDKPFVEALLKAHAGDPIRVDRQGRDPQYVPNPRLSMTIAIQPAVLVDIGKNKSLRGNGFIARILPTFPKPAAGTRTFRSHTIPKPIKDRYDAEMWDLGRTYVALSKPLEFVLSAGAMDELEALFSVIEPQVRPGGELSHMADWASKLTGAVARIAGLLHAAENGISKSLVIAQKTMANACRIGRYYLAHAKATHNVMSGRENASDAQHALDWGRKQNNGRFTVAEFTNASARSWDEERIKAALETLIRHGHARIMDPTEYAKSTGRTPSPMLELRPEL